MQHDRWCLDEHYLLPLCPLSHPAQLCASTFLAHTQGFPLWSHQQAPRWEPAPAESDGIRASTTTGGQAAVTGWGHNGLWHTHWHCQHKHWCEFEFSPAWKNVFLPPKVLVHHWSFQCGFFFFFFESIFSSLSDLLVIEKMHVWTYLFQNCVFSSLFPNSAPKKYEVLSPKLPALTQKTLWHICLQITSAVIS